MPNDEAGKRDAAVYPLLDQLDRLQEILEAMDDLGVDSRAEVERRMAELDAEIDRLSGG